MNVTYNENMRFLIITSSLGLTEKNTNIYICYSSDPLISRNFLSANSDTMAVIIYDCGVKRGALFQPVC
jgi:hypothetical protein